jgi:hypothetical protein
MRSAVGPRVPARRAPTRPTVPVVAPVPGA